MTNRRPITGPAAPARCAARLARTGRTVQRRRKLSAGPWLVVALIVVALVLDRLVGRSTLGSVVDFFVVGAACAIIGLFLRTRSAKGRHDSTRDPPTTSE